MLRHLCFPALSSCQPFAPSALRFSSLLLDCCVIVSIPLTRSAFAARSLCDVSKFSNASSNAVSSRSSVTPICFFCAMYRQVWFRRCSRNTAANSPVATHGVLCCSRPQFSSVKPWSGVQQVYRALCFGSLLFQIVQFAV